MLKLKVEELKGQTFILEHIVGNCGITYRLQYDVMYGCLCIIIMPSEWSFYCNKMLNLGRETATIIVLLQ